MSTAPTGPHFPSAVWEQLLAAIEEGRQAYGEAQRSISAAVHAFAVEDNQAQSSEQVEKRLQEQAQHFEQIAQEQSVKDNKDAAGKFRRQIEDMVCIVDAWWLWTKKSLGSTIGAEFINWLLHVLLGRSQYSHPQYRPRIPTLTMVYLPVPRIQRGICFLGAALPLIYWHHQCQ